MLDKFNEAHNTLRKVKIYDYEGNISWKIPVDITEEDI